MQVFIFLVFAFVTSCSINNKLQQPEAASGVLEYAMKHFGELVSGFISGFCLQYKNYAWIHTL